MNADQLRSAALLFDPELRDGTVAADALDVEAVRRAVRVRGVPSRPRRRVEQIAVRRRLGPFEDDSVELMTAARQAVLGERAAAGPPRLLVRVDEFPNYDTLEDPAHRVDGFRRFHSIMSAAGVPYLIAVQPAVAESPLDPDAAGGRPLDEAEREMLARLVADDRVAFALHGFDHRTRFEDPRKRSELEGRPPAELDEFLDRGMETLAALGIAPRVFVPPFNTFSAQQYATLASRFDVVCGGPETVARVGYRRTPLWWGDAVYLPCYPPHYSRASGLDAALDRLTAAQPGTFVPITMHWGWEADDGWEDLERVAARLAPLAVRWEELLAATDRSREAPARAAARVLAGAPRERLHVVSAMTSETKGGAEYATVGMLDALARRGTDTTLLTNLPELAEGSQVRAVPVDLGPKLGRRSLKDLGVRGGVYLNRLRAALRAEARRGPIDVFVPHFKKEQLMSALLPRSLAPAVVWAEWGEVPHEFRSGPARVAYVTAARRAEAILAVSENARRSLLDIGVPAAKVAVVPNIVDPDVVTFSAEGRERLRAEWGARPDTLVVGGLARLDAAKPNHVILEALEHLPDDVWVVLAGTGSEEDALREQARPFGPRARILPSPARYGEDLLSAVDVAVVAPHVLEGLPRAIAFAQLASRPVVVTDGAPVAGHVPPGTGAWVTPAHDPRALAAVLEEYRDDPERRAREGAAARTLAVERYDVRTAIDTLERAIRLAARAGARAR
jgi:glycosyltransferase involved in cell wall biosynthesis